MKQRYTKQNSKVRCGGIWCKVLIAFIISCSAAVWAGGNPPAAEDAQPNPTGPESGLKTQDSGLKTPSPDIFFPETKHAFGKVFVGEKVEHVFKVLNRGDAVLNITTIVSPAFYVSTKLDNWNIPPGGSGELRVTFSPDETMGAGKKAKFLYVESNDPNTPRFKLKITAAVKQDVIFNPKVFNLGLVPKGNPGTKRLEFESKITPDFEITKVTSDNPLFSTSYGRSNDGKHYYVEVFTKEDAEPDKTKGVITVYTNSEKQREIMIPVYAEIVPEVKALTERVCFGKVSRGTEAQRSFTVLHAKNVKVERVEPSLSWISAALPQDNETDDPSTKTNVEVKLLSNNAPEGKFEGSLSIYTNSKEVPVIKIHVCANVKELQTPTAAQTESSTKDATPK